MRFSQYLVGICLLLAACGGGNDRRGGGEPVVGAETVSRQRFTDQIDAIGTAFANEQVILSAPVTERVVQLNFADGGYVGAGQVIAELAQGQETAQLSEARARALEARQQLDRLQTLRSRGFATRAAVDTQVALAGSANAQAAEARASIGDRVVRAPFGGYISLRNISRGAVVTAGTEIATISDISRIKLDFAVPETLLASVKQGQSIEAVAAAYQGRTFSGTIESIDPVVNAETRSTTVRAIIPNPDRILKPGMLMTVTLESAARENPSVPELAIVGEGDRSFVFLLGADNVVKRMPVRIGARQNGRVEILQGLRAGQRVIGEGVVKLSDGMKVRLAQRDGAKPARTGS